MIKRMKEQQSCWDVSGPLHLVASDNMRGDEGIEVKSRMVGTWLLVPTLPLTGGVALAHFLHISLPLFYLSAGDDNRSLSLHCAVVRIK